MTEQDRKAFTEYAMPLMMAGAKMTVAEQDAFVAGRRSANAELVAALKNLIAGEVVETTVGKFCRTCGRNGGELHYPNCEVLTAEIALAGLEPKEMTPDA